jgi:endoribonuclease Dicer
LVGDRTAQGKEVNCSSGIFAKCPFKFQALSDVVESIVGAVYISDNFSPVGAESLFDNVLKPFFDTHITLQTLSHHPTKILFELLQAQGCQQFEITKEKDDSVIRCHGMPSFEHQSCRLLTEHIVLVHDIVLASGEDPNPAVAARRASFSALDALEGDPEFMTRTCDCRTHQSHKKPRKKTEFEKALEQAMSKAGGEGNDLEVMLEEDVDKIDIATEVEVPKQPI